MPRPIERLFVMEEMIRQGDYPSIQTFMKRFGIGERAAYGDMQYLKKRFHAPVAYSRKHGGYYYVLRAGVLQKQKLLAQWILPRHAGSGRRWYIGLGKKR